MIFEAETGDISQLDSQQLVQLMKRLLLAECQMAGVPLRAATVPLQITVPDDGEDGRVEWDGGTDATNFFPTRFCIFQSKAQNLTESKIKAEILKLPKKGSASLNAAVSEVLAKNGAYIVFCSHAFTGSKIIKLRKKIEFSIRESGNDPSRAKAVEVYDANRISDWINTHPAVALWLAEIRRKRSLVGFRTHESWGRDSSIHAVPWVSDDTPRFVPESISIEEAERKDRSILTFQQAAQASLKFLAEDKRILRVVGPSGFGKSRFTYELFNHKVSAFDEIERAALIYADLTIVGDESVKLAHEIAESGLPAILVVDECPDEKHTSLAAITRRAGSRLRLVTIDVETKVAGEADTLVLRMEAASDEMIAEISRAVAHQLNDSDVRFIRDLARGYPQMAVIASKNQGIGAKTIRSAKGLMDRIVWGRRQKDVDAQRALELLSLFNWVGLTGRVADQSIFIAETMGSMTYDAFVEHINSFSPRGIIVKRGDFVQVSPIPLAASLGAHRLTLLSADRLAEFFGKAQDNLKKSLLQRIRWLDTSDDAKAFARKLLDSKCIGNLQSLSTEFGSECLDRLVHVDPDLAMEAIERVYGKMTIEELDFREGRLHLVWALERLVFRNESFEAAATLLRRLAAKGHSSNNAIGKFTQLYQLYLSGTEASPENRLFVLDDGLHSSNLIEREVCVEALGKMLETDHFSRGGGAEEIGSSARLKDWSPKTYGEIWDFHRSAVKRLTDLSVGRDLLAPRAKQILGSHIRSLIRSLPLNEVKVMISKIASHYGLWVEAVQEVNKWLYYDRNKAPEEIGRAVRTYFDELMPSDPVDLAVLYTHGWAADFHDPDKDYELAKRSHNDHKYASRKAIEQAEAIASDSLAIDRALDRLVTSDAKTVYPFSHCLAERVQNPIKLFKTALEIADQKQGAVNLKFFEGLIAGVDSRDPKEARQCLSKALLSERVKKDAISLIGAIKLLPDDIQLVNSLLQSGDMKPSQCTRLKFDHLAIEDIISLLEELDLFGVEGLWTELSIISDILYAGKELTKPLVQALKKVLVDTSLFENVSSMLDGYHLEVLVKLLADHNVIDDTFAISLSKQLSYPEEVWTAVTNLLRDEDPWTCLRLKDLTEPESKDYSGPGLLFALPAELYLEWVRKDPTRRAKVVVDWLPIVTKSSNGFLSWHSAINDFIAEFGGQENVLTAISQRLHPRSFSGSLAPHLESLLNLYESWSKHEKAYVRKWTRSEINKIRDEIKHVKQRDEEDVIRYS